MKKTPVILVFAGPNGSGKSTVTKGFDIIGEYVNADDIKKEKGCTDLQAAQLATSLREGLVDNDRSFTFETVLSSERNVELLKRAKAKGYRIEAIFVLTADVQINIERVKNRVRNGGHDVPDNKIVSRYYKSLANLSELIKIADVMWVVDNSTDKADLIVYLKDGEISVYESKCWSKENINKLINKSYNN